MVARRRSAIALFNFIVIVLYIEFDIVDQILSVWRSQGHLGKFIVSILGIFIMLRFMIYVMAFLNKGWLSAMPFVIGVIIFGFFMIADPARQLSFSGGALSLTTTIMLIGDLLYATYCGFTDDLGDNRNPLIS